MKKIRFSTGESVPILGQGTWKMGEDPRLREKEAAVLRLGLDLGMTLIDTAEMYADGGAEEVVAEAIRGRRGEVFLVSKVLPSHARRMDVVKSCEASLRRLQTDRLDLYLLHWREDTPLQETLEGFQDLLRGGKIRRWGVSNFDLSDMQDVVSLPGGAEVANNQVLFNLARRGIEWDLLPWCRDLGIPITAYSPLDEGKLTGDAALQKIASRHGATPTQIAIAWLARQEVIVIPKSARPERVRENRKALDITLSEKDLEEIDSVFQPPRGPRPLETV